MARRAPPGPPSPVTPDPVVLFGRDMALCPPFPRRRICAGRRPRPPHRGEFESSSPEDAPKLPNCRRSRGAADRNLANAGPAIRLYPCLSPDDLPVCQRAAVRDIVIWWVADSATGLDRECAGS